MPDFSSSLSGAARALEPTWQPEFASLRARAVRRARLRRTSLGAAALLVVVAGGVALAQFGGGHPSPATPVPSPCVSPYADSQQDVFAAIPTSGTGEVHLPVGGHITIGWAHCGEHGTFSFSDGGLLEVRDTSSTSRGGPTIDMRLVATGTGTVVIRGAGSAGTDGSLRVVIDQPLSSAPSPYPSEPSGRYMHACDSRVRTDAQGRLLAPVSWDGDSNVLVPAGATPNKVSEGEALAAVTKGVFKGFFSVGHPRAMFGLWSASEPVSYNKDGTTTPKVVRRPTWLVIVCDGPEFRGSGGGVIPRDQSPAPGTEPSPGEQLRGVVLTVVDDNNGLPRDIEQTDIAGDNLLAERFIGVPFTRNHRDSTDGRQIGIHYEAGAVCAVFDHLDVDEGDADVTVTVWLRLADTGCTQGGDAVVGLRRALGERPLVRGH